MAATNPNTGSVEHSLASKDIMSVGASTHIEDGIQPMNLPVDVDGKALPFRHGRPIVSLDDERRMKRLSLKLDFWILPLLTLVMLLASMDRSDVSLSAFRPPLLQHKHPFIFDMKTEDTY